MLEAEEIRVRESDGENVNTILKTHIEGIIIKWAHQVRLKEESGFQRQPLQKKIGRLKLKEQKLYSIVLKIRNFSFTL